MGEVVQLAVQAREKRIERLGVSAAGRLQERGQSCSWAIAPLVASRVASPFAAAVRALARTAACKGTSAGGPPIAEALCAAIAAAARRSHKR